MHYEVIGSTDQTRAFMWQWMRTMLPDWELIDADARFIANVIVNDDSSREITAIVGLTDWTRASVEIHIASDKTKRWATREFITEIYTYVFQTCGLKRLNALVETTNEPAVKLHKKLGHQFIGTLEHQFGEGRHAYIFGLTHEQWRQGKWFPRDKHK